MTTKEVMPIDPRGAPYGAFAARPVAQWSERARPKRDVAGSNPARPANTEKAVGRLSTSGPVASCEGRKMPKREPAWRPTAAWRVHTTPSERIQLKLLADARDDAKASIRRITKQRRKIVHRCEGRLAAARRRGGKVAA